MLLIPICKVADNPFLCLEGIYLKKENITMKASQVFGVIISLSLIIFSISYPVPTKEVNVSSSYFAYNNTWNDNEGAEYIGGDAYNYQIEASLKAGYVSGVLAMKSITFVGGILLLFLTMYSHVKCVCLKSQEEQLLRLYEQEKRQKDIMEKILEAFNTNGNSTDKNDLIQV